MSRLLLESLGFTVIVGVGGAALLLIVGRNMEPARRGRLWLAWLGLLIGAYALQRAVTTQREEVRLHLDRFIRAIRDKNGAVMAEAVSTDYSADDFDRRGLLEWMGRQLENFDIDNTYLNRCDVVITGEVAEMALTATAAIRYQGMAAGLRSGDWTLTWKKESGVWRITNITVQRIDERRLKSMREIPP